jgi:hypothetical protein
MRARREGRQVTAGKPEVGMRSDSMFQQGWYTFIPSRPELVEHPRAVSHPKAVYSTALNRPTMNAPNCPAVMR